MKIIDKPGLTTELTKKFFDEVNIGDVLYLRNGPYKVDKLSMNGFEQTVVIIPIGESEFPGPIEITLDSSKCKVI